VKERAKCSDCKGRYRLDFLTWLLKDSNNEANNYSMTEAPRVFISYSHDSDAHKEWVKNLAVRLIESGVDVQLDQWDLKLGQDVTRFMEEGLTKSSRVLVVCSDNYIRKADGGEGGVGYERIIVTAELVSDQGTGKFIPIVRDVRGRRKTPIFLATRLFIDFSNDDDFEIKFEQLLRELHGAPAVVKPPLGANPYARSDKEKDNLEPVSSAQLPNLHERASVGDLTSLETTPPDKGSPKSKAIPPEPKKPKRKIEELYYGLGMNSFKRQAFKSALDDFRLVYKVNRNYKDVKSLIAKAEEELSKQLSKRMHRTIISAVACAVFTGLLTPLTFLLPLEYYYLRRISVFGLLPFLCGIFVVLAEILLIDVPPFPEINYTQKKLIYLLIPPAILLTFQSLILHFFLTHSYLENFSVVQFFVLFLVSVFINLIALGLSYWVLEEIL
jgi:hypothetical protein